MKHNQMRQVVFPILAAFIWGTAFVAQDMCADAIGAFTFNATRYFIAVLALLLVILIRDGVKKDKPVLSAEEKKAANRQLWIGGLCCGAALAIASNFQQAGLVAGTDAGKAGFITALYVVLVPVFGLFFKRKVSVPTWIAVVLSVAALYLLSTAFPGNGPQFFALLFSAVTQGILGAAGAVYANNLLKQYSKRKEEDQDADT